MSATRLVVALLPLVVQSSSPVLPSLAEKKRRSLNATRPARVGAARGVDVTDQVHNGICAVGVDRE